MVGGVLDGAGDGVELRCRHASSKCVLDGGDGWEKFRPRVKIFAGSPQAAKKTPPEEANGWRCPHDEILERAVPALPVLVRDPASRCRT